MEKTNTEVLYELIDKLDDEEFKTLLDTLSIDVPEDEDNEDGSTSEEEITEEEISEAIEKRKAALRKKIDEAMKKGDSSSTQKSREEQLRAKIQERLAASNRNSKNDDDQLRAQIREKLEVSRKKRKIQERIMAMRNGK